MICCNMTAHYSHINEIISQQTGNWLFFIIFFLFFHWVLSNLHFRQPSYLITSLLLLVYYNSHGALTFLLSICKSDILTASETRWLRSNLSFVPIQPSRAGSGTPTGLRLLHLLISWNCSLSIHFVTFHHCLNNTFF